MGKRPTRKSSATPRRQVALLVANPAAHSGRAEERIATARRLLDEAGLSHEFLATLPQGRTALAVKEALGQQGFGAVIAMGGDGTFSEVARGVVLSGQGRKVPLALLPSGTANDVGKSFGLSSHETALSANVETIARGKETDLDAAMLCAFDEGDREIREELFLDSAGFGFGPRVLRTRNEDRRIVDEIPIVRELFRDELVYAASALKTLGESYLQDDKFDVDVVADGRPLRWRSLNDLVVHGQRIYAGMWVLDQDCEPDDGIFEAVPFAGRRDWLSKALLYLDHSGELEEDMQELGLRHAKGVRAAQLELTFHPHRAGALPPAQVDGEEFPAASRVKIDVLPRALRLIVPDRSNG